MTHPAPYDLRQLPCGHLLSIEGDLTQCYLPAMWYIRVVAESHHAIVLIGACALHADELQRRYPDAHQQAVPH